IVLKCKALCVANKSDLPAVWRDDDAIAVSATTGTGLDELRPRIAAALARGVPRDPPALATSRHLAHRDPPHPAPMRARRAASADSGSLPEEFVLADLADARAALEEISGRRATDDLLAHIFQRFCVGK